MRLALGLYSVLVHTRGAGERGYIAVGLYSALVLTRAAWEQGKPVYMLTRGALNATSPGIVLCTGAHQGNLETRLAMGVNSVLVLTRRTWEQG